MTEETATTELTQTIITYAIGTTVFVPSTPYEAVEVDCPDCLGGNTWTITTPAGLTKTIACPRCNGGKDNWLKPKRHERTLKIAESKISGVSFRTTRWKADAPISTSITYETAPYIGTLDHGKVYLTREEAQAVGEIMMADKVDNDNSEWAKGRERDAQRAGVDIVTAIQSEADRKRKDLEYKIDQLREKMLEAAKFPTIDGPELSKNVYGNPELTTEGLIEWMGKLLDEADIERWTEEEIQEATCHC